VIPREGVESLPDDGARRAPVEGVIPREGVERVSINVTVNASGV